MSFTGVRPTMKAVASLMILAVGVSPYTGFSQSTLDSAADRQRQIIQQIDEARSRNGPQTEELIGPLTALALFYQEEGDQLLAAATITRVREVMRVNYGLHALEQAPLLQQLIDQEESWGNAEVAWDLEQELLTLARRHPDDLRAVPILRKIADERMTALGEYLTGELPPQVILGCYYDLSRSDNAGGCHAGRRSTVFQRIVAEAQQYYAEAISIILRNERYSSEALRELELDLVRSSDLIRHVNELGDRTLELAKLHGIEHTEPWRTHLDAATQLARWDLDYSQNGSAPNKDDVRDREMANRRYLDQDHYELGRLSLNRIIAYEAASASDPLAQVSAQVQLADWDLLYSRNRLAIEAYEQAHEAMRQDGITQASLEELFSPAMPVVLPAFTPNPLLTTATPASARYIDVAFEITRYGKSRRIEILDSSEGATRDEQASLVQIIKRSRFRPRPTDGRFADSSVITVRYYL